MTTKDYIVSLLNSTNRSGISNLIAYLNSGGFFESPASVKHHGCYKGGLADHCVEVYTLLFVQNVELKLNIDCHSLVIAGLLHDLCKVGKYQGTTQPYTYKPNHLDGHALLSLKRIEPYIELKLIERIMIQYHMGVYGTYESNNKYGEYLLQTLTTVWNAFPIVKIIYFCDEIATLKGK